MHVIPLPRMFKKAENMPKVVRYVNIMSYIFGLNIIESIHEVSHVNKFERTKTILKLINLLSSFAFAIMTLVVCYLFGSGLSNFQSVADRAVLITWLGLILMDIYIIFHKLSSRKKYNQIYTIINSIVRFSQFNYIKIKWNLLKNYYVKLLVITYGISCIDILFLYFTDEVDTVLIIISIWNCLVIGGLSCQVLILLQTILVLTNSMHKKLSDSLNISKRGIEKIIKFHYEIFNLGICVNMTFGMYFLIKALMAFFALTYSVFIIVLNIFEAESGYIWIMVLCVQAKTKV